MNLLHTLRYAGRQLLRNPGLTVVAVLTLGLGIGANTAIFSVVHGVLLDPLPYRDPGQLAMVRGSFDVQKLRNARISVPELFDLAAREDLFTDVSGLLSIDVNFTGGDRPERVEGLVVGNGYFSLLGVEPQIGRFFTDEDWQPGLAELVLLSDELWRRRFGADPGLLGQRIRLDNDFFTVLGVAPAEFRHPGLNILDNVEIWVPCGWTGPPFGEPRRGQRNVGSALVRLRSDVTVDEAKAAIEVLSRDLRREFPEDYPETAGWSLAMTGLHESLVGDAEPALLVLLVAVGFVLLIACANVANLQLARAAARQREIAVRQCLGAGRRSLIGQHLVESSLLGLAGGLLGLVVTVWALDLLVALAPADLPRLDQIEVNLPVLAFTLGLSLLTGILFGLVPALQAVRPRLLAALRDGGRGHSGGRSQRTLRFLVVAEISLALVLLTGATLLIRSYWQLMNVDIGFSTDRVLTARLWLPQPNVRETGPYFETATRNTFYRQVVERLAALPGVETAGAVTNLPLDGRNRASRFQVEGHAGDPGEVNPTMVARVAGAYFETLRIPRLRGRLFDDRDDAEAAAVAIVNATFARLHFPGKTAVGERIRLGDAASELPWMTIVGVVGDVRNAGFDIDQRPQLYRPLYQAPGVNLNLVVRTASDPAALAGALHREVQAIDADMPVFGIRTLDQVIAASVAERRFLMILLSAFAAVSLALAAMGIYGVLAYSVRQRTHEIGIRMALGASLRRVLRMVLREGVVLSLFGVALGLVASAAVTRLLSGLLFGVGPYDPVTFFVVAAVLVAIALGASLVPAFRAARVDPMEALRVE